MHGKAADRYKQVRASTSTPGELLLALYDGLFRFLNGAKLCLENQQASRGRELIGKARAILDELSMALNPEVAPELCANLSGLYNFALFKLSEANRSGQTEPIDEVLRVLSPLREAWQLAVPKALAEAKAEAEGGA